LVVGLVRSDFGQRDKLRADRSKRGVRSEGKEEAAQRDDHTKAIPIIAVTAFAMPGDEKRALGMRQGGLEFRE
jgi:hypothetical protein